MLLLLPLCVCLTLYVCMPSSSTIFFLSIPLCAHLCNVLSLCNCVYNGCTQLYAILHCMQCTHRNKKTNTCSLSYYMYVALLAVRIRQNIMAIEGGGGKGFL